MVLIMEAIVIGLAIPVALTVQHAPARAAGIAGGSLAVAAVVLAAVARWRLRWTLIGGSVLQLLVIAAGGWSQSCIFSAPFSRHCGLSGYCSGTGLSRPGPAST